MAQKPGGNPFAFTGASPLPHPSSPRPKPKVAAPRSIVVKRPKPPSIYQASRNVSARATGGALPAHAARKAGPGANFLVQTAKPYQGGDWTQKGQLRHQQARQQRLVDYDMRVAAARRRVQLASAENNAHERAALHAITAAGGNPHVGQRVMTQLAQNTQEIRHRYRIDEQSLLKDGLNPLDVLGRMPGGVTGIIDRGVAQLAGIPMGMLQLASHPSQIEHLPGQLWGSVKETFTHPLGQFEREPLTPLLNLTAVGSLGAGAALRGAAAVGEEGGLLASSKAFLSRPQMTRELTKGGETVRPGAAKAAGPYLAQKAADALRQHILSNPESALAEHLGPILRPGRFHAKQIAEESAFKQRMMAAPAATLAHESKRGLFRQGPTAAENFAIGLHGYGTPTEHIAYAEQALSRSMKEGEQLRSQLDELQQGGGSQLDVRRTEKAIRRNNVAQGQLTHMLGLTHLAAKHLDENGQIFEEHLVPLMEATRNLAEKGEALKHKHGSLGEQQGLARMGRMRAEIAHGAGGFQGEASHEHEARLGEQVGKGFGNPAKTLAKAQAKLEKNLRLQGEYRQSAETIERVRSREEAQRRLDELVAQHDQVVAKAAEHLKGGHTPEELRRETLYRNAERAYKAKGRGRAREGKPLTRRIPTVNEEFRSKAEQMFQRLVEKHRDEPWAKKALAEQAEIDRLREAIDATEPLLGGREDFNHPGFGTVSEKTKPTGRKPDAGLKQLRREESQLRNTTLRAETQLKQQQLLNRHVELGREVQGQGGIYWPHEMEGKHAQAPSLYGPKNADVLKAPADKQVYRLWQAKLMRRGAHRTNVPELVAKAYRTPSRLALLHELHQSLWRIAEPSVDRPKDVRLKTPFKSIGKDAAMIVERKQLNEEERAALNPEDPGAINTELEKLFPRHQAPEGSEVRYLPRDVVKMVRGAYRDPSLRFFNEANQIARIGRYSPAYSRWFLQNATVGLTQQGIFMPRNIAILRGFLKTAKAEGIKGKERLHRMEASVGGGYARNLPADAKFQKKLVTGLSHFWNGVVDKHFRLLSFVHEAHRAGYKTAEDLKRLLDSPDNPDLFKIGQAAEEEAIRYRAGAGPLGQDLQHWGMPLIYSLPWLRGATRYTARFPMNHPYQAALYGQGGAQGAEELRKFYAKRGGMVPSYMGDIVPTALGGLQSGILNVGETPASFGQEAAGAWSGKAPGALLAELSPVMGLLIQAFTGRDEQGLPIKGGIPGVIKAEAGSLPGFSGLAKMTEKSGPHTISPRGPKAGIEKLLGDPFVPYTQRGYRNAAASALKDYLSTLPPADRYRADAAQHASKVAATINHLLAMPSVPAEAKGLLSQQGFARSVMEGYHADAEFKVALTQAGEKHGLSRTQFTSQHPREATQAAFEFAKTAGADVAQLESAFRTVSTDKRLPKGARLRSYASLRSAARTLASLAATEHLRQYRSLVHTYTGKAP